MNQTVFAYLLAATTLGSFAHSAESVRYRIEIGSVGNRDMDVTLKTTSDLQSLRRTAPVSPFGLIARARGEVDRLKTVLEGFGYYQSNVTIRIDGLLIDNPSLSEALTALPKGTKAQVVISFTLGPLYHLGHIDVDGDLPEDARGTLGLTTGQPAVALTVLAAGARLQNALQEQGYAFAQVDPP